VQESYPHKINISINSQGS